MKKPFVFVIILFSLIIVISVLNSVIFYDIKDENKKEDINNKIDTEDNVYDTVDEISPQISVYDVDNKTVVNMKMEEYLYGVLSSEMPSTFDLEALKAQAVAARTYVIYKKQNNITSGHKNAVVCTNSAHCQAYTSYENLKKIKGEKWIDKDYKLIKKAVDETKGQIVVYNNKPILPLYFSTSSGKTENSKDVFSTSYPYLVSVDSPYDTSSPKYETTFTIDKNNFIKIFKESYSKANIKSDTLNEQIKIINRTEGGGVRTLQVGNIKLSGVKLRQIFNLNSANFTIKHSNDKVIFTVKGYGHGVGMSQWGAQGMAKSGYKYYDILSHYYKNTNIKDLY